MEKKTIIWIVVAVVVIAILIALALTGSLQKPASQQAATSTQGNVAAPGASPVNEEGKVVTSEGKPVRNDVQPMSPEAPQQSNPITAKEIPASAMKVTVSAKGFEPSSFTVKAGAVVNLSVTSGDTQTHIFKFDDSSLEAVAVGLGPNETRLIPFNAPTTKGEYAFHCDVPGHAGRGETGKMIVN